MPAEPAPFTLGPELGQLFGERVLGLLQLPPLLLHVLHVVRQGLDLGFVLETANRQKGGVKD